MREPKPGSEVKEGFVDEDRVLVSSIVPLMKVASDQQLAKERVQ